MMKNNKFNNKKFNNFNFNNKSKFGKRTTQMLAAAVLSASLIAGQASVVWGADSSYAVSISSLIPDNVTIESPVSLSQVNLPGNEYGTLSWADGSYVPSERVQSCEVIFTPYDSAAMSGVSGWDAQAGVIYGSVTVVVNNISSEDSEEYTEEDDSWEEDEDSEEQTETEKTEEDDSQITEEEDSSKEQDEEKTAENDETNEKKPENSEVTTEETPEVTPQITKEPDISKVPDVSAEPELSITPDATVEPEQTIVPEISATPSVTEKPGNEENIFDHSDDILKEDDRTQQFDKHLSEEEQEQEAQVNHSYNGIYVSGINLPWYVQFRVSSGDSYKFTNESDAVIFQSYEFELWDLQNNTEYHIPDGEYISITVPVKEGYDYTIEHLLDTGAMETIVPSVEGDTMVFSTHSFSPFGIAGSKPLVGSELSEDNYPDDSTDTTAATPAVTVTAATAAPADSTVSDGTDTSADSSNDITNETSDNTQTDTTDSQEENKTSDSVNTGDNTTILPFIILAAAAVVIIGIVLFLRKKKK